MINKLSALNDNVTLRPHQESAVNFIDKNKKGILAHGTGLGKTLTSIAAFERLKEKGEAGRALVIVPASLRSNYVKNIKQFTNSTYSVYGPKNERNSKKVGDPSNTDYNVISYELFKQDPQGIKDRLGADTLIIDEVHRARNESSGINHELATHTPAYRNVITLTGSVVNNAPSDISPLMDATFGRSGNTIGTRGEFNRRYTTKVRKGGGFLSKRQEAFTTMNNRRQLAGALSGKVHYVSHNDLEQALPPIQEETVKVPMTDAQKKLYLYSFKDLPPMTKAKIRKNIPVSQKEMSSLFAKLMMSRKVMTDPASMDRRLEGQDPYMYSPKVKRVIDDMAGHLSESPRNKVVVYGNLLGSQIDTVKNVLDSRNVPYSTYFGTGNKGNNPTERDRNLKDYMSGKNRVLLISGAGGEGLDLKGTSMMQMLEGHYNPEKIQQAEARVRRMGDHPDKPIQIKQYVSTIKPGGMDKFMGIFGRKYPTSIDEYIYTVADRKDRLNQDFRDSLMKGAMLKVAVDISTLPNIYKSFNIYKHPFTRAARRLGLGSRLPFRGGVTSGLKGPVYGKSQGIHIMQRPSTLLSERLRGHVELPELSKDGKRAIDAIVTAHEGLELRSGRKILGRLTETPAPYDMSRLQTLSYMVRNNINKSKEAVGSALNSNKYNRVTSILDANRFSSHVSPEVLLQEGNIIATLKGKGAMEASDYMRKLRAFSGESSQINDAAKSIGMDDYEWGVTRINRHRRKALAKALLAMS